MKKLDIKQFSSAYEYEKAAKQLKKQTHKQRNLRKSNGNLHILSKSGEPKEVSGVIVDNMEYGYV